MAGSPITTSLVVSFTDTTGSNEGSLSLEIDDRLSGLNQGQTSFYAGDSPGFLLYKTSNAILDVLKSSEGSIQYVGDISITKEQDLVFANTREASLSYPASSVPSVVKKSPGAPALTLSGQSKVLIPTPSVAFYKISYTTVAKAYRLTGAAGDISVVIYAEGHV